MKVCLVILLVFGLENVCSQATNVTDQSACSDIAHCSMCPDPPVQCEHCNDGTVKSADRSKCLDCSGNCEKCVEVPGGQTECATCEDHHHMVSSNKTCAPCPGKCDTCSEGIHGGVCEKCLHGYYPVNKEVTCQGCSANCDKCVDSTSCLHCRQGFYINALKQCAECPSGLANCVRCTSSSKCDQCVAGKYWDGTSCQDCMLYCAMCMSGATCDVCSTGHVRNSDGSKCLSTSHCSGYSAGVGCSACDPGYKISPEKTCVLCPVLTSTNCQTCHSDTRGRFWDSMKCKYCTADCLSCTSATSCDKCKDGKVWDSSSRTCVDCTTATLDSTMCTACTGKYWDSSTNTCHGCSTTVATITTMTECGTCGSHYWATGQCINVDCSSTGLNETQCSACPEKYWNSGSSSCQGAVCTAAANTFTDSPSCEACENRAWKPDSCDAAVCSGSLSDETRCTVCATHFWSSAASECQAMDCSLLVLPEESCMACHGRVWDGSGNACLSALNCDTDLLDTREKCESCRRSNKYWDGTCLDIDCAADTLNDTAECHACPGKYWDGISSMCKDSTTGYCSGSYDQEKCTACEAKFWDNVASACVPATCERSNPTTKEECETCDGRYWDAGQSPGTECQTFNCSAGPSNEHECIACEHQNYLWDSVSTICRALDCSQPQMTKASCVACDRAWKTGQCKDVVCSTLLPLDQPECSVCFGAVYDGICRAVDCSGALTSAELCNNCKGKYWDSSAATCVDLVDCTSASLIIHSEDRCVACAKDQSVARIWDTTDGKCFDCPMYCTQCDEDKCITCKSGKFWDPASKLCVDCSTNPLNTSAKCQACPGKFWDSTCKDCMTGCVTCTNSFTCSTCTAGLVYDSTTSSCLDCVYEKESECISCGTSVMGKFFDQNLCYDCPAGCEECSSLTVCTKCASSYYKLVNGAATECRACSGVTLDTVEKCTSCGASDTYWDAANSACPKCITNCLKCTTDKDCTLCSTGRFFDTSSGTCASCPSGCLVCKSATQCQTCENQKYFDSGTTTCKAVDPHCSNADNPAGCTRCDATYHLVGQVCKACMAGCDQCQDETTCSLCSSGRCWDEANKACQATTRKCRTCTKDSSTDAISCTSCVVAHQLEVCKACAVTWCQKCDADASKCEQCYHGYYYNKDAKTCTGCGTNCESCEDGTKCGQCKAGSYWDSARVSCEPCSSGCKLCKAADLCDSCLSVTAFKNDNGGCTDCPAGCQTCSDVHTCTSCLSSKYLDATTKLCANCPANCVRCDGTVCMECGAAYFLNPAGVCEVCSTKFPNCHSCHDKDGDTVPECTWCNHGYTLRDDGKECVACTIAGCGECRDPAPYCSQCDSDYITNEDKDQCVYGCYTCTEGDDGCDLQQGDNSTVEACSGLRSTHGCWIYRSVSTTGVATVEYDRKCHNETCTAQNSVEKCATADSKTVCGQCCDTNKCNTGLLTGSMAPPMAVVRTTVIMTSLLVTAFFKLDN